MFTVVYFASLRERLGVNKQQLELPSVKTVNELVDYLVAEGGDNWQQALKESQVMVAVNQEMCELEQPIVAGDEIAFFPPVTGG